MSRQAIVDSVVLFILTLVLLSLLPPEFLEAETPATGADLGSHYWPFHTALNHGYWTGNFHVWNPGNLAGEPHLVHYFPFPFYFMTFLALFFKPYLAYNLGIFLPAIFLPYAVYFFLKRLRFDFPRPILGALASVLFLLNDSYDAWGGNITSALCGQFSHLYALNAFLIGGAFFVGDLKKKSLPWRSSLFFAITAISHAYVALSIPIFVLTLAWFTRTPLKKSLLIIFKAGLISLGLASFWLIPAINHQNWANPSASRWLDWVGVTSYLPVGLMPIIVLGLIIWLVKVFLSKDKEKLLRVLGLFIFPSLYNLALVFIFPLIDLVDIRAIPQILLFMSMLGGVALGSLSFQRRPLNIILTVLPAIILLGWSYHTQKNIKHYTRHAFSGWSTKPGYKHILNLSERLRGDFSDPRVAFENGKANHLAGTPNVFEMLPFFSGRATIRSLYFESSHFARVVQTLESFISENPSCLSAGNPCLEENISLAYDKLLLLGVNQIIISSEKVLDQADEEDRLKYEGAFGPWFLYKLTDKAQLVEVLKSRPEKKKITNYKKEFPEWFSKYTKGVPLYVDDSVDMKNWNFESSPCRPKVKVEMNRLTLETPCPGRPHYMKFAYHGTLRADSGDKLHMTSPGFFIIVPSQKKVVIRFGQSPLWFTAKMVTLITILGLIGFGIWFRKKPQST